MEVVAAVGEAFCSTMFEALLKKLQASDLINYAPKKEVLRKWEKRLKAINAVLADAEEKQVTNRSVKIWLKELQELAHDIEDVLGEFAYEGLRRKSVEKKNCLRGLKWSGEFNVKTGSKIKDITKRLDEIATKQNINSLGLGENVGGKAYKARDPQRQPTTSVVSEVNVFGRGNEKEAILNLLLAVQTSDDGQVPVLNITGMSGIGKTTLAQLVYNDGKVEDFFDLKAWIHVPEDFDVTVITKSILDAVVNPRSTYETNDLDLLQLKLKQELSGKKFLLVLDDVWHQDYEEWSLLIRPFEARNSVCKIIVTTQDQNVSQITGSLVPAFPLKELADDYCLSILARHALERKNFDGYPHLKEIGKEIVKKCKGLPLAVIALASLLRNKRAYNVWEDVSRCKMWDLIGENKSIVAALGLSYHRLPSHLKPCFAYCSLIPKGHEFDRDELVILWTTMGFVQQEDLGRKYFSDLLSRSFFQQSNNDKSLFVMHDLVVDLAQSVAGNFCFNMEHEPHIEDGQHYPETARHVSFVPHQYDVSKRFEIFNKMKHPCLRSFLALPKPDKIGYCYLSSKVLQELLPKLKGLRVLSLSGYFIEELPSSIGDLKHLWSLNLSRTAIRSLPRSVGTLYHLRKLILKQCKELTALPVQICGLSLLRRLDIRDTPKLQELPSGIGNLISLRILPKFIIGKAGGLALRELKDLSLQGQLSITGLHNVVDIQDAWIANLRKKNGVKELDLKWSNYSKNEDDQMSVLEALHPSKYLQRLSISYYRANEFPHWIGNPSFTKIEQIDLFDCINCRSLPSLGRLPLLRSLNIRGMHAVTEFYGDGFPSLEILRFEYMPEWKEWNPSAGNEQGFPLLRELILHDCPKLAGTLPSTRSLVNLDVQNCQRLTDSRSGFACLGELTMEGCSYIILRSMVGQKTVTKLKIKGISDLTCINEELSKALMKLEVLEIEGCRELTWLWRNGSELENLSGLKSLVVKNCPELVSLVEEKQGQGLYQLTSLEDLRIECCHKFVSLPATGLPCTLKFLTILECKALKSLPDTNGCNTEELTIVACPSLKSFPKGKLPSTLKSLRIENCENLKCLPSGIVDSVLPLPNLKVLSLSNCTNLRDFPNQMWNLESLQELSLSDCLALTSIPEGGLPPNITSIEFRNCKNLKQPMSDWGLDKLNCLTEIIIAGACPATDIVSFPDQGLMLPSTLIKICLEGLLNLESLSWELENIIDLQELHIKDCRKLRFLPKTGLPSSLGRLCISGCHVLRDKCKKVRGEYWSIICDIPCLEID